MAAYIIAQVQIEDRERYSAYQAGFMEIFSRYDAEILAVDEAAETLEGEWPYTRTVILRFASKDEAKRWYQSAEYQTLAQHRFVASDANLVLVEGFAA